MFIAAMEMAPVPANGMGSRLRGPGKMSSTVSAYEDRSPLGFILGRKPARHPDPGYRPRVTVLVPAYNEEPVIRDTIGSIRKQTYPVEEIIVIDDCSTDRTNEIASSLGVTVIRTPKNTGSKSQAQNFAISYVKTGVFVTIDADTTLDPRAIELLIPALADQNTLSACGFVIPQVTGTFWERARLVEYLYGLSLFKSTQEHWSTPLVSSGCFSAFNLKLFRKAGKFPEDCIAEDMALTWKAHLMGYSIRYVPEAISYPMEPSNWPQYRGQVLRWYRGFFQCVTDQGFSLLGKPRLAAFIGFYLVVGLLSMAFYGIFAYTVVHGLIYGIGVTSAVLLVVAAVDVAVGFGATLAGGYRTGKLKEAVTGYPLLWIVSPLNSMMFLYSFWQECVKKNKLTTWEKGH